MKATRQAALNVDRFTALPVGAFFELYGWSPTYGYMLHGRFEKMSERGIRECGDGRVWDFAQSEGSGASVVLVPEGDPAIRPFDARANNQLVESDGQSTARELEFRHRPELQARSLAIKTWGV